MNATRILPAIILTLALAPDGWAAPRRANLVFLLADQWRAQATGFAGDPNVKTPNLDRLANQSLLFRNAISVCPVCTPYRAALLTGRYPTTTGMFMNDLYLPDEEVCLAEVLRNAGYATAYIGKWHLDGHGRGAYIPPERRQGFDYWKVAECDHNYPHSHYYEDNSDQKRFWDGYDAFAQTRDAAQYVRDHARDDKPFFLFVSYGVPHFPHATALEEYKALYSPEKIELRPNVPDKMRTDRVRREACGYYAHCTALDKCIAEMVQAIDQSGIGDNTILVFTSDHGEMMGSQGCPPCQKQTPYDESIRVPFLLRYPPLHASQARDVKTPLNTPDIMPTLLSLAHVAIPATVEGDDLSDLVLATTEASDRAALIMNVSPFADYFRGQEYRGLRTSRYTYVRNLAGPWLLFDNETDPYQLKNLADQPEQAALQKQLDGRLQAALKKIGDDFRPRKAYQEQWGYEVDKHGCIGYSERATKVQSPKRARVEKWRVEKWRRGNGDILESEAQKSGSMATVWACSQSRWPHRTWGCESRPCPLTSFPVLKSTSAGSWNMPSFTPFSGSMSRLNWFNSRH
jgi:arylsulfatase A-like enzyme